MSVGRFATGGYLLVGSPKGSRMDNSESEEGSDEDREGEEEEERREEREEV